MSITPRLADLLSMTEEKYETNKRLLRVVTSWFVIFGSVLFAAIFLIFLSGTMVYARWFLDIMKQHMAAAIGLPLASIVSLCVVIILEISSGPIEFEGLGFKFRGASGPVVLWVFCFLTITASIKILW